MNDETLNEILSCQTLPSLPAVALRVIELTSDVDVSLDELANVIQQDQGLAAKILRTVNSSFYGLRQPCSTISKALVMLGLSPVKSLALGFSLVSAIEEDESFDFIGYWRRGLYTGVGAKCIADALRLGDLGDEVFLGGLLQDIGELSMHIALGHRYDEVHAQTDGNHRNLVKLELSELEVQHPDIGAMLAKRWKLPDRLVMPIKYHERPGAAPVDECKAVQLVYLGNLIHDLMTLEDRVEPLRRLYERSGQWFDMSESQVDEAVERAGVSTKEVSRLFRLDTGSHEDATEVLESASRRMIELSREDPTGSSINDKLDTLLAEGADPDPMTGFLVESGFKSALAQVAPLLEEKSPISIVQLSVPEISDLYGRDETDAADDLLYVCASQLKRHFEAIGGIISRLGVDRFAVVLAGVESHEASQTAERFREDLKAVACSTLGADHPEPSARIGVSCADSQTAAVLDSPEKVYAASWKAVRAAEQEGGDCVCTFSVPKRAA